jgi:hypothetical protein
MKTKVLVWRARNGGSAEEMLNAWLDANRDKEIVRVCQSESGSVIANLRITYTIFYN